MLTQQTIQERLDAIAEEVSRSPGMYYELYSRLFSERVKRWICTVPGTDAVLIERVADNDPDYSAEVDISEPAPTAPIGILFNPAWDVEYQ